METVKCYIPDENFNQLNNFYLENYGYDIFTQIQIYLNREMKKCTDYSTEPAPEHPTARLHDRTSVEGYTLNILYPDGSRRIISGEYDDVLEVWEEWSKYSFDKEAKDEVILKIRGRVPNIQRYKDRFMISKIIDGKKISFGIYDTFGEAKIVRDYLAGHDWDLKYRSKEMKKHIEGCNQYTYSDIMMKIANGEMEYEVD